MHSKSIIPTIAAAVLMVAITVSQGWAKMIIAQSSSRFLPGSSLPALAITVSAGAESVYLKLAMTADNQVVVLEDTAINEITNAAEIFPGKIRPDGSYHVMDFTLDELHQLSLFRDDSSGLFPSPKIGISTLDEALDVVRAMQHNLGRRIEVIGEIKKSWQYRHEDRDISRTVVDICRQYGYTAADSGFIIASYDPEELQRIHEELFSQAKVDLKILQLVEGNNGTETRRFELGKWLPYNYDWLYTKFGLKAASSYADMVALMPGYLVSESGDLLNQQYIEDAHLLGINVILQSIDHFAEPLPAFAASFESLVDLYLFTTGADGMITAKDQLVRGILANRSKENSSSEGTAKTTIEILLENLKKQQNN